MEQIVDITADNRHLSKDRGFLRVTENQAEVGRVPLDQIAAVIVHAHGVTYSNALVVALAEQGASLVICGPDHAPRAILWPLQGHFEQGARMRAQWTAKQPLLKQMWKQIVVAKILMQAAALSAYGAPDTPVRRLAQDVRSGDPKNVEAQAAQRYWRLLMGEDFRRDKAASGANALLNYGYTVIRSAAARAVIAAGLQPTIGVFHANRNNAFALADDVMEPFRPLVDCAVKRLLSEGVKDVCPDAKRALARLIAVDLTQDGARRPLTAALARLSLSLARSFETGEAALDLPQTPTAMEFRSLGAV